MNRAGISNPTDLVKTHMQKGGGSRGGPFAVLAQLVRTEGVRGLWVGTTPSMVRWGGAGRGAMPSFLHLWKCMLEARCSGAQVLWLKGNKCCVSTVHCPA